jgi:hypothetical protein
MDGTCGACIDHRQRVVGRLPRKPWTAKQFLRIWWILGLFLAVPVSISSAVLAGFYLPLVMGISYPVGWTVLIIVRFGWVGLKSDAQMRL